MARRLEMIFLVLACAGTALAQATIPDTPAGHALSAWLESFNSGDRVRMDAFLRSSAPRLTDTAFTSAQFRGQSGGLNLLAVTSSGNSSIAFRVQEKSQATILIGKFELTTARPQTISNVVLRAVPPGAVLEDIKLDDTHTLVAGFQLPQRPNERYRDL